MNILINQLGYTPGMAKVAVLRGELDETLRVCDAAGNTVLTAPGLTPLLEEARWELEWMLKMQRADGGVYHKVSCARFCGMIMPHEEKEELIISPVSTTATGDFAACMAMASRFYAGADPAFARRMLEAAKRAWDFLQGTEPMLFRNPEGISTGGYGDRSDADERLWAHVEQTEAYTSLFQNKSKYNAMMAALAGLIYREFNAAQGGV